MNKKATICFIGCGVLGPEIRHAAKKLSINLRFKLLPGRLHNTPHILRTKLQEAIDEVSAEASCQRIIIGYGLCGRGTVGIKSSSVPLVIPKVHDCISLFLGSDHAYKEQFTKFPGTYYITKGWYEERMGADGADPDKDRTIWIGSLPIGCSELTRRYGKRNGKVITDFFRSWTKHYKRAAYIDMGVGKRKVSLDFAIAMARENGWAFDRICGNFRLLNKLLVQQVTDQDILYIPPTHVTLYSAVDNCLVCAPCDKADCIASSTRRKIHIKGTNSIRTVFKSQKNGLGIDAGGTYTDIVVYDYNNRKIVAKNKSLTTKWDFSIGIRNCLAGLDRNLLKNIGLVSVSTTLATNAIVEGVGQKTGLLIMNGELSDTQISHFPKQCIKGFLSISGEEKEAIDENEILQVIHRMQNQEGVTAFAVSGFAGTINPVHECQVKEILKRETGITACCGHEFSSELNFVTRAQTAVINGRIIPKIVSFFRDLDEVLSSYEIFAPVMVVKGDGTLMSKTTAMERPVETILSGPAASVAGARCLTGLENALVVDIGGTTTDIGDIQNGAVTTSPNGANIGGLQTHVQALQMKTVGLGGDSHIRFINGKFIIGPSRVAPLVWAGEMYGEGIEDALAALMQQSLHRQQQLILVGIESNFHFKANEEERRIHSLLLDRPLTLEQLAKEIGVISPTLLNLPRLEDRGMVQRCGLTPTDVLHVNDSFCKWPTKPANDYVTYLSERFGVTVESLTTQLLELISNRLAQEVIKGSVFGNFSEEYLASNRLFGHVMDGLTHSHNHNFRLNVEFIHPIVGIGAPAQHFLPRACEILTAKVIIPPNAEVANALGAITSHIAIHKSISIEPNEIGGYAIKGVAGNPNFQTIAEAEDWSISYLKEKLTQEGRSAGTYEDNLDVDIEDRTSTLSDGSLLFLGRKISASLLGKPTSI